MSEFFVGNPMKIDKGKLEMVTIKRMERIITLDKAAIDKNTEFINKLEHFSVSAIAFAQKYKEALKVPSAYSLDIVFDTGKALTIEAEKADDEGYIGRLRSNPTVFFIKKKSFEDIFEGIDKLNLKADNAEEPSDKPNP